MKYILYNSTYINTNIKEKQRRIQTPTNKKEREKKKNISLDTVFLEVL